MRIPDDEAGGDPPCWSHLLDSAPGEGDPAVADLPALARAAAGHGPAWTMASDDLHANLVAFDDGDGIGEHVNAELDVLLVGVLGVGLVTVDGTTVGLRPGWTVLAPKGARRSVRAVGGRFAYLTCHRRRPPLVPTPAAGERRDG